MANRKLKGSYEYNQALVVTKYYQHCRSRIWPWMLAHDINKTLLSGLTDCKHIPYSVYIPAPSLTEKSGTHPCSRFKMIPLLRQNTYFLAQNGPFLVIKHRLFIPK